MPNRHSLSTKVICLVGLPLLVQLVIFFWLATLERSAESELKASTQARAISDTINLLSKDIFSGIASFSSEQTLEQIAQDNASFSVLVNKIRSDYQKLKALTATSSTSSSELYATVNKSGIAAEAALKTMVALCHNTEFYKEQANDRMDRNDRNDRDDLNKLNKPLWNQLHRQMQAIDFKALAEAGKEQKLLAGREPEVQAKLRREIMYLLSCGSLLTIALGIALAVFLTREITSKLELLTDNAYRLASDLPLNPELLGQDDIARLDKLFHRMALELRESARKEKAVIENALDLICTLDAEGRLTAVNPAITTLFGYLAKDVLGKHFASFVDQKDESNFRAFLASLKTQAQIAPLELQLVKADGAKADLVLSAGWSYEEKKFFVVAHDMTEKRQSERIKEEVLAMVTHDLRTPLFTIQNIFGFLAEDIEGKVEQRLVDYVSMGESNAERMLRLINDLIDSEKMRAKALEPDLKEVNLDTSFENCREVVTAIAEDVGVTFKFQPSGLQLKADESMLDRILFNLTANAIKFSPKGSTVLLTAEIDQTDETDETDETEPKFARIMVEDDGPGIPQEQLGEIFERFRQGSARSSKKLYASSGLGLSICKSFVALQNGKIWVESELGKGSKFCFTLPLAIGVHEDGGKGLEAVL
jgi:PAS domain S-box-containing protein